MDADVHTAAQRVIDGLCARSCVAALAWCAEHRSKLRKLEVYASLLSLFTSVLLCFDVTRNRVLSSCSCAHKSLSS